MFSIVGGDYAVVEPASRLVRAGHRAAVLVPTQATPTLVTILYYCTFLQS